MRFVVLVVFTVAVGSLFADAPNSLLHDDYSKAKHETRKPLRGDWKIHEGVASVSQDDELYKKYKNHGPIMVYEIPHDDAVASVTFKPSGCKAVVFTMDAKDGGHAFRVKMSPKAPGVALTYIKAPGAEKAKPVFLNKELPKLKEGQWTTISVRVVGKKATVSIGDTKFQVEHDKIDQAKKIAKLGFSFGSIEIKQFDLQAI